MYSISLILFYSSRNICKMAGKEIENLLKKLNNTHYLSGPIYREAQLSSMLWCNQKKSEMELIYNLTEAHAPGFRYKATAHYLKCLEDPTLKVLPMLKDNVNFECSHVDISVKMQNLLDQMEEMPKEWTLVQITHHPNLLQSLNVSAEKFHINPINITVFNCGQQKQKPVTVCVNVPKDNDGRVMNVIEMIHKLLKSDREAFSNIKGAANKKQRDAFADARMRSNEEMRDIVKVIQNRWLREWKTLLIGKYVSEEVENQFDSDLEGLLKSSNIDTTLLTEKSIILLKYIAKGHSYLDLMEIKRAVEFCLPEVESKIRFAVIQAIKKKFSDSTLTYNNQKRHPCILIIDESLDQVPWEMLDVLMDQPISRMQSFHFTYALYKEHENYIVDGWKTNVNPKNGTIILNPGKDLIRMENRLSAFFSYWTPSWQALVGIAPTTNQFIERVSDADIFCYNGHGDGFQFVCGATLQKLRINAVVLLFGCSSVQLSQLGPQSDFYGSHQNYIIACSPCVVGMLWTVSDYDVDLMSTDFLSRIIPSDAPCHWNNLDKTKWRYGDQVLDLKKLPQKKYTTVEHYEPELLTALLKSKKVAKHYLTQAACVARGIPVKIGI